jgi:uncharacterized protein
LPLVGARNLIVMRKVLSITLPVAALVGCLSTGKLNAPGMSFTSEPLLGKIVWNDLITEDPEAARRFYGGLFGWTFEEASGRRTPYWIARSGDVYVGGLVQAPARPDGSKVSRWLPFVSVENVDLAVTRATGAGGEVAVSARDVGIGRVAAVIDREGAVIGLARSRIGDPDDKTTRAAAGRVVWTELLTNDASAAAAFYRSVVGYDARTIERRGGEYTVLGMQGADRAGILKNPTADWRPVWLTYFGVDDPVAASARVETLGGKVLLRPSPEVREGTMAVVADPTGAILVLQKLSS